MTTLQQTCGEMLRAQDRRQGLLGAERSLHNANKTHIMEFRIVRETIGLQTGEIRRCQALLASSMAANDEPVPGAAA